jgi:hypothetical protein
MRFFGVGELLHDLVDVPAATLDFCAAQGLHLRCSMDARKTWGPYHARMDECARRDITLLPILQWTWDGNTIRYPNDQASRDYWQVFCRDVSNVASWQWGAYGRGIAQFELYNEPNLPRSNVPAISPYDYVGNVLKPGRTGIRQYTNSAIIVGGLAFGRNGGRRDAYDFIRGLYGTADGGAGTGIDYSPYFDAIGVHPYGKTRPTDYISEDWPNQLVTRSVAEIDRAIAARSGSEPLLITEIGRPSQIFNETSQRNFLDQVWSACTTRPAIKAFSNWHVQDRPGVIPEHTTGLHRGDWSRKPAADWFINTNNFFGKPWTSFPQDP